MLNCGCYHVVAVRRGWYLVSYCFYYFLKPPSSGVSCSFILPQVSIETTTRVDVLKYSMQCFPVNIIASLIFVTSILSSISACALTIPLQLSETLPWWMEIVYCSFLLLAAFFQDQNLFLRWLKPVSKLSRNVLVRRSATTTLYHVLAMLFYHKKHQLLLNKMRSLL